MRRHSVRVLVAAAMCFAAVATIGSAAGDATGMRAYGVASEGAAARVSVVRPARGAAFRDAASDAGVRGAAVRGAALRAAAAPVVHVVAIREFRFEPASLDVAEGDTIRWVNRDPVPHTATAADSSWDSGRIPSERSWSVVVGRGMSGKYVCAYHPTMTGVIRVVIRSFQRSRQPEP